jgi:hypothetical protein
MDQQTADVFVVPDGSYGSSGAGDVLRVFSRRKPDSLGVSRQHDQDLGRKDRLRHPIRLRAWWRISPRTGHDASPSFMARNAACTCTTCRTEPSGPCSKATSRRSTLDKPLAVNELAERQPGLHVSPQLDNIVRGAHFADQRSDFLRRPWWLSHSQWNRLCRTASGVTMQLR